MPELVQLDPQRVGIGLEGEFGARIGTAKAHGDKAEDRRAHDDAAVTLAAHDRDDAAGQLMPAEEVRLELRAEHRCRNVFQRARLRIGAVVEERVEPAARRREHRIGGGGDGILLGIVEVEGVESFRLQRGDVLRLAGGGEDAPAARLHAERGAAADPARAAGDEDGSRHSSPHSIRVQRIKERCRSILAGQSARIGSVRSPSGRPSRNAFGPIRLLRSARCRQLFCGALLVLRSGLIAAVAIVSGLGGITVRGGPIRAGRTCSSAVRTIGGIAVRHI